MKIAFITDGINCWQHGIWWHRNQIPSEALSKRGHGVKQFALGAYFQEHQLEWPDTVIFGRTYPTGLDPVKQMREFKKRGKRVLYDMDDDFWEVAKDNPSVNVSNALKDQYESMIKEADAVITPSKVLAKKFKKYFKKPIFICPNGVDLGVYLERPSLMEKNSLEAHIDEIGEEEKKKIEWFKTRPPVIGYMGAASHWKDLQLIGEVLAKLAEKYEFHFMIYGLTAEPMEAAMYAYNRVLRDNTQPERNAYFRSALDFYSQLQNLSIMHVPFMPPELHPKTLSRVDLDIGIAPLEESTFNSGKSCVKFYEYAAVGTAVLASDVMPYSDEVGYRAKNTFKDWYNKLERLIVDYEFREKVRKEQGDWVKKHRSLDGIGVDWELACQLPSDGPTVRSQR